MTHSSTTNRNPLQEGKVYKRYTQQERQPAEEQRDRHRRPEETRGRRRDGQEGRNCRAYNISCQLSHCDEVIRMTYGRTFIAELAVLLHGVKRARAKLQLWGGRRVTETCRKDVRYGSEQAQS